MSHISLVQTLVKARGKKSNTVFLLPKLLLSLTSTRPEACLDLRLKSGALEPTGIAIICSVKFLFSRGFIDLGPAVVNLNPHAAFGKVREEKFRRHDGFGRMDAGPGNFAA